MEQLNQSVKENLVSELKALGLSTIAAKAYLALLSKPSATAGLLCHETGIPDSKIYYAIDELSKKGMIVVQNGTPKTYKAVHPKEATGNLKQQLREDFNKNLTRAENLADALSPIFESVTGKTEMELAYVIRGHRNIARKMKDLITSAKKEALILVWESDLWNELRSTISEASDRVEMKIAISKKIWRNARPNEKARAKILECSINMVISDMRILLTVSSWENEVAIMTNDKALMTISQEYYQNPRCCAQCLNSH